jgi:exopolysaccharide biosynthesis polyprenyl glycosylphosphotransferase
VIERAWRRNALARLALDLVLTELSMVAARLLRPMLPFGRPLGDIRGLLAPLVFAVVAIIWVVAFLLLSVYETREQRSVDEAQAVFVATSLATLILASLLYFSYREVSRLLILTFYVIDLVLLIGSRFLLRARLQHAGLPHHAERRVLIVGAGEGGRDVCRMIQSHQWTGLKPVGFLDDGLPPGTLVEGIPVLGKVGQVREQTGALAVDEVVIALPLKRYDRFFSMLDEWLALPATVRIVPDHIKNTLFRTRLVELAGVPMITLQRPALSAFERVIKHVSDLVIALSALVFALPLSILIAIAIRLDSPGPVIFRQQRVGEGGQLFWMFKFRSMVKDAEQQQAEMLQMNEEGELVYKHRNDPRITRVGRIIRRTSLDEMPQILNVLRGEMSIVGPRPELPVLVERYEPWQWQRLLVPQGITGWWQVNGRSDKPMYLHTEDDLYYIQNYSLLLDIQILWRTAAAVLKREGAF